MRTDVVTLSQTLKSISEGNHNVSEDILKSLMTLNLVIRVQESTLLKLTQQGASIIELWGTNIENDIQARIANLIKSQFDDDAISDALGVPGYQTFSGKHDVSKIGRYLGGFDPSEVIPIATVLGDVVKPLRTINDAVRRNKVQNKIFVRGTGFSGEETRIGQYLIYGISNYDEIVSGAKVINPINQTNLSFISRIPFGRFVEEGRDLSDIVYYTIRYVLTGEDHHTLSIRLDGKRFYGRKTLKAEIDERMEEAGFLKPIKADVPKNFQLIYAEMAKDTSSSWGNDLVQAIEQHRESAYRFNMRGGDQEFLDLMSRTPMLFIGDSDRSSSSTSLSLSMDFGSLPEPKALEIFGAEHKTIQGIKVKSFITRLATQAKLKQSGGGQFSQSEVEKQVRGDPNTQAYLIDLLSFILGRSDSIDSEQMENLLNILIEFGIKEIDEDTLRKLRRKGKLTDNILRRFSLRANNYHPRKYMSKFPSGEGELLTVNSNYFYGGSEHIGLGSEIEDILEGLGNNEAIVYIDETGYSEEGNDNDYNTITERIQDGLVQRIMSGDVPEAIRNHSVVFLSAGGSAKPPQPTGLMALLFAMVSGRGGISLDSLKSELSKFVKYNPRMILILQIDQDSFDSNSMGDLLDTIRSTGIKLLIRAKKHIPGTSRSVRTSPITEEELKERMLLEIGDLKEQMDIEIDNRLCMKLFGIVGRFRRDGQDPLWLCHEILKVARNSASGRKTKKISDIDMSAAIAGVMGIMSVESISQNKKMIEKLPRILKGRIVGQNEVIDRFCDDLMNHMTGGGNPERPLTYLFPGPTGVGKTLFAEITSRNFNLPFLSIDGSQYTESHTSQRLTSSPPGYVGSDKDGVLTRFMKDNLGPAIVFVDEIDKMHPTVRLLLMNFFDEGKMTAGDGIVYRRPQYTVVVATNAGAEKLRPGLTQREVLECIGEAFKDSNGVNKPELASRFRIAPMLPVPEDEFRRAIKENLLELGMRSKFTALGIEVVKVSQEAIDFIFTKINDVCRKFDNQKRNSIGFNSSPIDMSKDGFFNLREIVRAIDASIESETPEENGEYEIIVRDGRLSFLKIRDFT